jgi:hypothetical protein
MAGSFVAALERLPVFVAAFPHPVAHIGEQASAENFSG